LINAEIASAKAGSPLYKKAPLEDPSENLIRAHVATLEWNMMSRKAPSNGSANCFMEGPRLDAIRLTSMVIVSGTRIRRCVEYQIRYHNRVAVPVCLPCPECTRSRATHSVLLEWEQQQYHPVQVQRRNPGRGGCRLKTQQWDRQQTLRDQHLDVALRSNVSTGCLCG
jgi:hypothetical protein